MLENSDESGYQFGDPRRLFEAWRRLSGEDLLSDYAKVKLANKVPKRQMRDL
jgi:hypothetical protein